MNVVFLKICSPSIGFVAANLSISPLSSVSFCFLSSMGVYGFRICNILQVDWFFYFYKIFSISDHILSAISIAASAFLWLVFAEYIFSHSLTFNLYLRCIFCKPFVSEFYFYLVWQVWPFDWYISSIHFLKNNFTEIWFTHYTIHPLTVELSDF